MAWIIQIIHDWLEDLSKADTLSYSEDPQLQIARKCAKLYSEMNLELCVRYTEAMGETQDFAIELFTFGTF